jgi:hypothetical protein
VFVSDVDHNHISCEQTLLTAPIHKSEAEVSLLFASEVKSKLYVPDQTPNVGFGTCRKRGGKAVCAVVDEKAEAIEVMCAALALLKSTHKRVGT